MTVLDICHFVMLKSRDYLHGCVHALDDSGKQLSLVNPRVIDTLNLPRYGKVVVRGALGDPVCAPLVNLQLRLPGMNEYTGK